MTYGAFMVWKQNDEFGDKILIGDHASKGPEF